MTPIEVAGPKWEDFEDAIAEYGINAIYKDYRPTEDNPVFVEINGMEWRVLLQMYQMKASSGKLQPGTIAAMSKALKSIKRR